MRPSDVLRTCGLSLQLGPEAYTESRPCALLSGLSEEHPQHANAQKFLRGNFAAEWGMHVRCMSDACAVNFSCGQVRLDHVSRFGELCKECVIRAHVGGTKRIAQSQA